jgi:glutamyl endopeptidase
MPNPQTTILTGPHAPGSNNPPDETHAPSADAEGQASPDHDGTEEVKGHKKTEGAPAELFKAPTSTQLRDIGEASFGPPPPEGETVHGPDDRAQITNTTIYPWRAHASLLIVAADNSTWIGTGWFIGPHTLMTAGHVVYIKNSGVLGRDGWVKSIQVMPGRNGTALPFGSVTSTNFRSVAGWFNNGDQNYDYGAIITPTNLGNTTGWFGYGAYSDADLLAAVGNISGYPADKSSGTQWYDHHKVASVDTRKVYYDIDTAGGQSGSAVYRIIDGGRFAVAVHAYGGATTNSGTRIVVPMPSNMTTWRA